MRIKILIDWLKRVPKDHLFDTFKYLLCFKEFPEHFFPVLCLQPQKFDLNSKLMKFLLEARIEGIELILPATITPPDQADILNSSLASQLFCGLQFPQSGFPIPDINAVRILGVLEDEEEDLEEGQKLSEERKYLTGSWLLSHCIWDDADVDELNSDANSIAEVVEKIVKHKTFCEDAKLTCLTYLLGVYCELLAVELADDDGSEITPKAFLRQIKTLCEKALLNWLNIFSKARNKAVHTGQFVLNLERMVKIYPEFLGKFDLSPVATYLAYANLMTPKLVDALGKAGTKKRI